MFLDWYISEAGDICHELTQTLCNGNYNQPSHKHVADMQPCMRTKGVVEMQGSMEVWKFSL